MKQYSYYLFPLLFFVLGILVIGLSLYALLFSIDYTSLDEEYQALMGAIGFILIGAVLLTFRGRIIVDKDRKQIIKENRVLGLALSKDPIKIPDKVKHILIQEKSKQGKGYFQAVVGFSYRILSSDVYFINDRGAKKIISTDQKRAIKIAEILKDQLNIDYSIKRIAAAK